MGMSQRAATVISEMGERWGVQSGWGEGSMAGGKENDVRRRYADDKQKSALCIFEVIFA